MRRSISSHAGNDISAGFAGVVGIKLLYGLRDTVMRICVYFNIDSTIPPGWIGSIRSEESTYRGKHVVG